MADVLVTYLHDAGRRPWAWGEFDCCLFFADWLRLAAGRDPAAELRGTYATEREMRRLVKARGGIVQLVDECLTRAGCRRTARPDRGDIGLVRIGVKLWRDRVVTVPTGALALSPDLWAVKTTARGLALGRFPLVAAWTF